MGVCSEGLFRIRWSPLRWAGILAIGVLVNVSCLAGAPSALADAPLSWSVPAQIAHQRPFSPGVYPQGMSCASASLCAAGDSAGDIVVSTSPAGDATAWTVTNLAGTNEIFGVGCTTTPTTLCIASGGGGVYTSINPTGGSGAWTFHNLGIPNLLEISCLSSSLCVAVDENGDLETSTSPNSNNAWAVTHVPSAGTLHGISCTTTPATLCVATDGSGNVITSTNPTAGAGAWTVTNVDGTHGLGHISCPSASLCVVAAYRDGVITSTNPTGGASAWTVRNVDPSTLIQGVSCASTSLCVATANNGDVVTSTNPADPMPIWSAGNVVPPSANGSNNSLGLIACPATSLCLALSSQTDVYASTNPAGGASSWHRTVALVDGYNFLDSVSCPSASLCVAVDQSGNVVTSTNPTGGSSAWTMRNIDGSNFLSGVSCPSASLCVAVDQSGNLVTSTNPAGGPSAWTVRSVDGSNQLSGVSCASVSLCVAGDRSGNILTSTSPDSGSWTVRNVDGSTIIFAVSCTATPTILCVAGDQNGALTSTNPSAGTWTPAAGPQFGYRGVSCPSASLCVAVGAARSVFSSTNPTGGPSAWTSSDIIPSTYDFGFVGITCPAASVTLCVGVNDAGDLVTTSTPTGPGTAWTVQSVDPLGGVHAVSCPSNNLCVGVGGTGNVVVGSGTAPATQSMTVAKAGTGAGSVTSQPAGVDCGGSCSHSFDGGTQVTLTPTPASGSTFAGWSGACSGTGTCQVTMNRDQTVTATFNTTPPTHTLTVSKAGSGSGSVASQPAGIDCGATCSHSFDGGTQVTLTPTPASGSTFAGWSGACSGSGACQVALNSDQAVTANFNTVPPPQHVLSVSTAGPGSGSVASQPAGIDCGATCSHSFAGGTQVTLTPTAAGGSTFAGWSGGCAGSGACQVTLNSDQAVTATFSHFTLILPSVSGMRLTPTSFPAHASRRHKRTLGTAVSYKLNIDATVRFTIQSGLSGRRTGKGKNARCVAPTARNRKARKCTRMLTLGSFSQIGRRGTNSFRFNGRVSGKTLKPGKYTLFVTPSAHGATGRPVQVTFRIIA